MQQTAYPVSSRQGCMRLPAIIGRVFRQASFCRAIPRGRSGLVAVMPPETVSRFRLQTQEIDGLLPISVIGSGTTSSSMTSSLLHRIHLGEPAIPQSVHLRSVPRSLRESLPDMAFGTYGHKDSRLLERMIC